MKEALLPFVRKLFIMENQNFTATLLSDKSPEEVFDAVNNVRGWWSENIEGKTDQMDSEFTHRDRYLHVTFKITHLTRQKIIWDVVDSHCNMFLENLHEWEGTRIVFEITRGSAYTEIRFTHQGLVPQFDCYQVCSKAWDFFITTSLKNLLDTGKGDPISNDYASFTTAIEVDQSPEEVFEAIKNVRGWWLNNIEGPTDQLQDEFKFYVNGKLQFHFRIIEMVPHKRIVWLVLEQNFKHTEKQEWNGSTVLFEISALKGKTKLRFTHEGLVPPLECYEDCQNAWTQYIQVSLFNFIQHGEGQPNKW